MREIRPYGSVRGVRRKPYPYRDKVLPVRSTVVALARNPSVIHAFDPRREAVSSTPATGFLWGRSASEAVARRTRSAGGTCLASGDFRNC